MIMHSSGKGHIDGPDRRKSNAALISIISNLALVILKFITGTAIGSVSIVSEAVHSSVDLLAAIIAFFPLRHPASQLMRITHSGMERSKIYREL